MAQTHLQCLLRQLQAEQAAFDIADELQKLHLHFLGLIWHPRGRLHHLQVGHHRQLDLLDFHHLILQDPLLLIDSRYPLLLYASILLLLSLWLFCQAHPAQL